MLDVMISVAIVEWIAKDMHYRSCDEWFYALHLLADKVDFGNSVDDLKEAYYLGAKESLPPTEEQIVKATVEKYANLDTASMDNRQLIEALATSCADGIYAIEEAKREPALVAGVHAILDGISQKMLVVKGLCWRTLSYGRDAEGSK